MKHILVILNLLLLSSLGFSQENKLQFGLSGGLNYYALLSAKGFEHKFTTKPGSDIGLITMYRLSPHCELSLRTIYESFSYHADYAFTFLQPNDPYIPRTAEVSVSYLNITPTYGYVFTRKGRSELFLEIGPTVQLLASHSDETTFEDNSVRDSQYLNKTLYGVSFTCGVNWYVADHVTLALVPELRTLLKAPTSSFIRQRVNVMGLSLILRWAR